MKLNKYNNFVFESTIYDLLLESNLIYMKDFRQILNDIRLSEPKYSPVYKISNLLLRIAGKDMKLVQNYIDVDKESDKVSFIPDNRIQHESNIVVKLRGIEDNRIINIVGDHSILDSCGISREGLLHPMRVSDIKVPNEWILLGTYDGSLHGNGYEKFTLHHLQNISDPTVRIVVFDDSSDGTSGIEGDLALPDVTKSSIKVGRFVNRILDIYFKENPNSDYGERGEYSAADVEKFVNKYTATVLFMENVFDYFEIVKGEEIKKWYSEDKYAAKSSQLGNSCMRYNNCQDYFGIYNENPEVCKLLIFKNMNGDKIFGRALLWTDIDGQKLMDRVYTTKDSFMALFKKWAKENNYRSIYKEDIPCIIKVEAKDYGKYPYMDTFKFYSLDKGLLYSDGDDVERPYYRLEDTGGRFSAFPIWN